MLNFVIKKGIFFLTDLEFVRQFYKVIVFLQ